MPMGTLSAGNGYGVQVIYQGGATVDNPTAGEQVLIATFDRQRGVSAVPCMFYGGGITPPNADLPKQSDGFSTSATAGAPGDVIISAPPAQAGGANSFIRLRQDGTIQIWAAGQVSADIQGGLSATVNTGNVNLTVNQGNATIMAASGTVSVFATAIMLGKAAGDTLLTLCTSAFQALFNSHTHGEGPPPDQQAGPNTMTSVVTAE
jgi:hypothetical protein